MEDTSYEVQMTTASALSSFSDSPF